MAYTNRRLKTDVPGKLKSNGIQPSQFAVISSLTMATESRDSPGTRYRRIIQILRFCTSICGSDVIDPNFRLWALSYAIIFIILSYYACTLYTIYVGVVIDNNWTVILQAMALCSSAIQGLTKMLCCVEKSHLVKEIQATYESIYHEYEVLGGEYSRCLHERISVFWNVVMVFVCIYIAVVGGMVIYPVYTTLVYKEKVMIMQFLVPFIDHTTYTGHLMLMAIHVLCVIIGGFGNFGADMYLFLFILNVPLIKDLFKIKLQELNAIALQRDKQDQLHSMLRELLLWHQKYGRSVCCSFENQIGFYLNATSCSRILRATEQTFNKVMLVELSTLCIGILCTISCIFLHVWPTAPLYLVYCFVLLYAFCGLGTVVETSVSL